MVTVQAAVRAAALVRMGMTTQKWPSGVSEGLNSRNTHFPSLYKAFPPDQARSLVERFEWHYTPKHGSWLKIAENEIGVFTRTVLKERVGSIEEFLRQAKPGCDRRNQLKSKVNWQFKAEDARTKMKSSYPSL